MCCSALFRRSRKPQRPADGSVTARPSIDRLMPQPSNRAIGRSLHISEATAKTHLVHAFTKLGVDDRRAAQSAAISSSVL